MTQDTHAGTELHKPRKYNLLEQDEINRLFKELKGYMRTFEEQGTDMEGRIFAKKALFELPKIFAGLKAELTEANEKLKAFDRLRFCVDTKDIPGRPFAISCEGIMFYRDSIPKAKVQELGKKYIQKEIENCVCCEGLDITPEETITYLYMEELLSSGKEKGQ